MAMCVGLDLPSDYRGDLAPGAPPDWPVRRRPITEVRFVTRQSTLSEWLMQHQVLPSVAVSTPCPNEIEALAGVCTIRDYRRVYPFLDRNPFLTGLVIQAYQQVQAQFGACTQVVLQLVTDPDSPASQELFGLIRTSLPVREATERLAAFDQEWWIEASTMANLKLNFAIEFI